MANLSTANDLVTEVQALWRSGDSTAVNDYLQVTMNEICRDFPLAVQRVSLILTAGTQEYSIGTGAPWYSQTNNTTVATTTSVARIKSAIYLESSESSGITLTPTVPEELIETYPTYRYDDSGNPTHVYTTVNSTGAMSFGLYPKPDTTSVNNTTTTLSYPRVDFEFHSKITFTGTTTVPSSITNPMVLVYGTAAKIARREGDPNRAAEFDAMYNMELGNLSKELASRHIKRKTNFTPTVQAPRVS